MKENGHGRLSKKSFSTCTVLILLHQAIHKNLSSNRKKFKYQRSNFSNPIEKVMKRPQYTKSIEIGPLSVYRWNFYHFKIAHRVSIKTQTLGLYVWKNIHRYTDNGPISIYIKLNTFPGLCVSLKENVLRKSMKLTIAEYHRLLKEFFIIFRLSVFSFFHGAFKHNVN